MLQLLSVNQDYPLSVSNTRLTIRVPCVTKSTVNYRAVWHKGGVLYAVTNVVYFLIKNWRGGDAPHVLARALAMSEACGMPGRGFMGGDVADIMGGDINLARWFEGAAVGDPSHIEIGISALRGAGVRFDPIDVLLMLFGIKEAASFITKMVEGGEDAFPDRKALVEAIDARLIEMGVAWKPGYADTFVGDYRVLGPEDPPGEEAEPPLKEGAANPE